MQLRNIGTPLLIFAVFAGFTIWSCWQHHPFLHVRDLFQSARTYLRFSRLVPSDVVRYPMGTPHSDITAPKIIHQILLNEHHFHDNVDVNRFKKYTGARNSCINLHPDWEYMLWTDENATDWVREHYPKKKNPFDDTPEVYQPYIKYPQTIQRTNILRYLLLHHYGGVYLDVDIWCQARLDPLLQTPFLTPAAHPTGINNAFILARPRHPFLVELIEQIPEHNLTWNGLPYAENMLSTGCMFISNAWMNYMRKNPGTEKDRLYILGDEHNNTKPHMLRGKVTTPLFRHGGESSWHREDAAFIFWIGKHWKLILVLFAVFAFVAFLSVAFLVFFFLLPWKWPCWLGGRCRGHCSYGRENSRKFDVEYSEWGAFDPRGDPNPLASNVAMHSSSLQGSDAHADMVPFANTDGAHASNRRGSDAHSVADSVASDATIRPTDGGRNLVVARR